MKQFLSMILESGTPKQRKQKTFAVVAIGVTVALIVIALVTLCVLAIVDAVSAPAPAPDGEGGGSTNGAARDLVTTTFEEGQLYRGNLIVTDDTYVYNADANAAVETISIEQGRVKVNGSSLYSSNALQAQVQKEALDALNSMTLAFYEATTDDNLWVNLGAYGAKTGIYAAGNTFELRYTTGVQGAEKPAISESDTYDWIFNNAYKYGFIQLFDEADTTATDAENVSQTHIFRYVGLEHAALAKDAKCNTLDAYLAYLRDNTSITKTKSVTVSILGADGKTNKVTYKVFYQPHAEGATYYTAEPTKFKATVSGDNMGGYIVSYCAISK